MSRLDSGRLAPTAYAPAGEHRRAPYPQARRKSAHGRPRTPYALHRATGTPHPARAARRPRAPSVHLGRRARGVASVRRDSGAARSREPSRLRCVRGADLRVRPGPADPRHDSGERQRLRQVAVPDLQPDAHFCGTRRMGRSASEFDRGHDCAGPRTAAGAPYPAGAVVVLSSAVARPRPVGLRARGRLSPEGRPHSSNRQHGASRC